MKQTIILILALFTILFARDSRPRTPIVENSRLVHIDSIYVEETDTVWTDIFWQAAGEYKSILIEANDDSTAGTASDSACAQVTLWQVWDIGKSGVIVLPSRAHPDSTTWPNGSDFIISDSLDILSMEDSALWARGHLPYTTGTDSTSTGGDTIDVAGYYNNVLDSIYGGTQPGGYAYYMLSPDYSPGLVLRFVGRISNLTAGSRWRILWFQQKAQNVTK